MQHFEPPPETRVAATASPPAHADTDLEAAVSAPETGPRRDVHGQTLDDGLRHDRRVRARILRRAKQVTNGIEFCASTCRVGEWLMRHSWTPLRIAVRAVAPESLGQFLFYLFVLCFCWAPVVYIGGTLIALGLGGFLLGWTLWTVAALTRAALALYLRHLVPW